MPEIVLTEDLNPSKGRVAGAVFRWPRATITRYSEQLGREDWYQTNASVTQSINRTDARNRRRAARQEDAAKRRREQKEQE